MKIWHLRRKFQKSPQGVIFRTYSIRLEPHIQQRSAGVFVADLVNQGAKMMNQEASNHSDYEPTDYRVDAKAIVSGFVMLLLSLVAMIAAN